MQNREKFSILDKFRKNVEKTLRKLWSHFREDVNVFHRYKGIFVNT